MKSAVIRISSLIVLVFIYISCKDRTKVDPNPIDISDITASDIQVYSAKLTSSITKVGTEQISEHGFAYSKTSESPTTSDVTLKLGSVDPTTPTPINFAGTLNNLEPKTEYFVRAFASTAAGTYFSKTTKFTTSDIIQPVVKTDGFENVTHNAARLKGSITTKGTHAISEYGLVWGATADPTTSNTTKSSTKADIANFPSNFTANADNLTPNTTYHFRAYVISNNVTSYGANTSFKTGEIMQPKPETGNATDITTSSAKLAATIASGGTLPISERGVVWATTANPTTSNFKASINGNVTNFPASYEVNANNLSLNTVYNYRAYVISEGVTTYGENKTFRTQDAFQPKVVTEEAKAAENLATIFGTITERGSHNITEFGVVWGTGSNPTTANSKASTTGNVTNFPHRFSFEARSLNPATTYNYRAFVTMNGVTTYGENKTFVTSVTEPRVTTGDVFTITGRGTVMTGVVNSQGSFPITEIGIVYGTANNPTTSDSKLSKNGAGVTFPHNFEFITNSFAGTSTIYFRAYVISNGQTYYGVSKVARAIPPSLSAGTNSVSGSTYTLRGSVTAAGTYDIREYGIVWSSTSNTPTTSHNKLAITTAPSTIPINFTRTVSLSTIGSCRGVYYRTYAITSNGTTYYSTNIGNFATSGCIN